MPGRGRPQATFKKADVIKYARQGLTMDQIALCLGVHPATLYNHKRKKGDFLNYFEEGRALGIQDATALVHKDITVNENVHTAKWFLERIAKWTDKPSVDDDDDDKEITLNVNIRKDDLED